MSWRKLLCWSFCCPVFGVGFTSPHAVQPPSRWENAVCAGGGNTKLGPWLEEGAAHLHPPLVRWGCSRTWTQFGDAPSGMLHASLEGSRSREEGGWKCGRGPVSLNPPLW